MARTTNTERHTTYGRNGTRSNLAFCGVCANVCQMDHKTCADVRHM